MGVEERKYKYALETANITSEEVDKRFDRIDKIMSVLKVGDKLYQLGDWSDIFEQEVTKILDKENGIVELYERSINNFTVECVAYRHTLEEAQPYI